MCLEVRSISGRSSRRATTKTDAVENLDECRVAAVAGNALRARLDPIERGQVAREVDGTDVLVEDDEAAGPEHPADLGHGVEIDGVVELLRRQRSGRDATGLHAAELVSVAHAAPDLFDQGAHGDTHRGLDQPDVLQRSLHGHHLGAGACRRPDLGKPLAAFADDGGNVGEGLRVVEDSGTLPETLLDRARRLGARLAADAHDGVHQRRALAADVGAAAGAHAHFDVLAAAEDVLADETEPLRVGNRFPEPLDGQRVLAADVVVCPLGAADRRWR